MKPAFLMLAVAAFSLSTVSATRAEPLMRYAQATPPAPAPQPQVNPAPVPAPKLTGAEAWKGLIGNTASGKLEGKEFADYYLADGTVKSMLDGETVVGKWALDGDNICFTYPDEPRECYAIKVVGDSITFTDKTGTSSVRALIQKGNAKNL